MEHRETHIFAGTSQTPCFYPLGGITSDVTLVAWSASEADKSCARNVSRRWVRLGTVSDTPAWGQNEMRSDATRGITQAKLSANSPLGASMDQ